MILSRGFLQKPRPILLRKVMKCDVLVMSKSTFWGGGLGLMSRTPRVRKEGVTGTTSEKYCCHGPAVIRAFVLATVLCFTFFTSSPFIPISPLLGIHISHPLCFIFHTSTLLFSRSSPQLCFFRHTLRLLWAPIGGVARGGAGGRGIVG